MASSDQPARTFSDLHVWRAAHALVLTTYHLTATFPGSEALGLVPQLRRAAVSVPANIAEGFPRRGPREKARYLNIAQASLEEVRYYLILSNDLGYAECSSILRDLDQVSRMLNAYTTAIRSTPQRN